MPEVRGRHCLKTVMFTVGIPPSTSMMYLGLFRHDNSSSVHGFFLLGNLTFKKPNWTLQLQSRWEEVLLPHAALFLRLPKSLKFSVHSAPQSQNTKMCFVYSSTTCISSTATDKTWNFAIVGVPVNQANAGRNTF